MKQTHPPQRGPYTNPSTLSLKMTVRDRPPSVQPRLHGHSEVARGPGAARRPECPQRWGCPLSAEHRCRPCTQLTRHRRRTGRHEASPREQGCGSCAGGSLSRALSFQGGESPYLTYRSAWYFFPFRTPSRVGFSLFLKLSVQSYTAETIKNKTNTKQYRACEPNFVS